MIMRDWKITLTAVLGLTLTMFFPAVLQPYVLQGQHILQRMTEQLGQAQSLFVSQRMIFYSIEPQPESVAQNSSGGAVEDTTDLMEGRQAAPDESPLTPEAPEPVYLEESIRYVFSQAFRSDIISDTIQRIYVSNAGQSLTVIDGMIADPSESSFDLYKDLLLYRSRETLTRRLTQLGVDVNVSSLGKFDDQLALVVGAEFPDETVPQVWVDKETFQPVRMIIPSAYGNRDGILDIRYSTWQQIGQIWYPMQIEFIQDGTAVRALQVDNYQINPKFPKDAFDIAQLMTVYPQTPQTPGHPAKKEGLSEVQKTIEQFKKIFE